MEKKPDFKSMSKKSKLDYFWEYYKWYVILPLIAILILGSLIRNWVTAKESVLDILMVNCEQFDAGNDGFDAFFNQEGFDPDKQEINLNSSIAFSNLDDITADYNSIQVLTVLLATGDVDLFFAPESVFSQFSSNGCTSDLTTLLPADLIAQYEDDLFYTTDPDTGETYPCGIHLTGNAFLSENGYYQNDCYFGIVATPEISDTAIDFAKYLLTY